MKTTLLGSLYRVDVSRAEVDAFKSRWPGSTLSTSRVISFFFDRLSGDLVDIMPCGVRDGADLLALSIDAQSAGMAAVRELV